ncbi:MAG: acyltransferase [Pseudomonas sp.]
MSGNNIKKYDYIDALRGVAIALVVLVHASQSVKPLSDVLMRIMAEGARGVQLFYIASAITLCMSWSARRKDDLRPVRDFYLRRIFRIAPMFYLAIVLFLFLNGAVASYFAPNGISWWFVPVTALFLHGFHPETINSVVPGGWSVAVEMTFYLIFPLLVRIEKLKYLLLLLAVSLLLQKVNAPIAGLVFQYEPAQRYLIDVFAFYNFISQFPVFVMGLITYRYLAEQRKVDAKTVMVALAVFFVLSIEFWHPQQAFVQSHVIAGAIFAIFSIFLARKPISLLVNPLMVLLGKLSFSMYLVHIAILKLLSGTRIPTAMGEGDVNSVLFFLFVLSITAVVSWVTYNVIEKPGIALGRRLIERLEAKHASELLISNATKMNDSRQ